MKYRYLTKILIFSLFLLMTVSSSASEVQTTVNSEYADSSVSVSNIEYTDSRIMMIDISENGEIAVALYNNKINIYDKDYKYKYGYRYEYNDSYYIQWENDTLQLYTVASHNVIVVKNKNIEDVYKISDRDDIWDELRDKSTNNNIEYKDKLFSLKKFSTELVVSDSNGENRVILKTTSGVIIKTLFYIFIAVTLAVIAGYDIISKYNEKNNSINKRQDDEKS